MCSVSRQLQQYRQPSLRVVQPASVLQQPSYVCGVRLYLAIQWRKILSHIRELAKYDGVENTILLQMELADITQRIR